MWRLKLLLNRRLLSLFAAFQRQRFSEFFPNPLDVSGVPR